jgi:hypothetical protein
MAKPQLPPEALAFAKQHILGLLASGRPLPAVIAAMKPAVTWHHLQKWRRDDPAFNEEIGSVYDHSAKRHYSDADQAEIKACLVHAVAQERKTLTEAVRELCVGWTTIFRWRRDDPQFEADMRLALEALTEQEADRLKDLHSEIVDPKTAKVASDNLRWWLEQRNAKFKPKSPAEESNTQLADIIRGALNRLIDERKQRPLLPAPAEVIDVNAALGTEAPRSALQAEARPKHLFASQPPVEGT